MIREGASGIGDMDGPGVPSPSPAYEALLRSGCSSTRHPRRGSAEQPWAAQREPLWTGRLRPLAQTPASREQPDGFQEEATDSTRVVVMRQLLADDGCCDHRRRERRLRMPIESRSVPFQTSFTAADADVLDMPMISSSFVAQTSWITQPAYVREQDDEQDLRLAELTVDVSVTRMVAATRDRDRPPRAGDRIAHNRSHASE